MEFNRDTNEIVLQNGNELEAASYALDTYGRAQDNEKALSLARAAAELDFEPRVPKVMTIAGDDVDLLIQASQNFSIPRGSEFTRPTIEALAALRQE